MRKVLLLLQYLSGPTCGFPKNSFVCLAILAIAQGEVHIVCYINLSETINNHAACRLGVVRDRSMFHLLVRWSSTAAVDSRELNTFLSARDDLEPGVT